MILIEITYPFCDSTYSPAYPISCPHEKKVIVCRIVKEQAGEGML